VLRCRYVCVCVCVCVCVFAWHMYKHTLTQEPPDKKTLCYNDSNIYIYMEIYIESNIYVHTHTRTHTGAPGQKIRIQARSTPAVAGSGTMFFPFYFVFLRSPRLCRRC